LLVIILTSDLRQMRDGTAERERGAVKAVHELYEVVTHELLSPDLRYMIGHMMLKIYKTITCEIVVFIYILML
jgi:hypothetical protein